MTLRSPASCSMPSACSVPSLDLSLTVNETLRRFPSAVAVLNAYGIDTCCGGAASLAEAATEVGVPGTELLEAITRAATEGA